MQEPVPAPIRLATTKPTRGRARFRREWLTGYLFILPSTVLIGLFGLFPIGYAIYMSLYRWRIRQGGFVGLQNDERVLGDWWGALAFVVGLLAIIGAHWLWRDAFRGRGEWMRWGRLAGAFALLGAGVSVPSGHTPEADLAAWLFLKHYTSPESQAVWAQASNDFPVRQSVAAEISDYFAANEAYGTAFDLLRYGQAEPPVPGYDFVRDLIEGEMAAIMDGADVVDTREPPPAQLGARTLGG